MKAFRIFKFSENSRSPHKHEMVCPRRETPADARKSLKTGDENTIADRVVNLPKPGSVGMYIELASESLINT